MKGRNKRLAIFEPSHVVGGAELDCLQAKAQQSGVELLYGVFLGNKHKR
jgi:hypothetical protein